MSFTVVKRSVLNIQNQLIKGHNKDVIELDKSRGFSDNISFKHSKLCASPGSHLSHRYSKTELRTLPQIWG